jgi:arylsulfatase A-like enzyme
MIRLPGGVEGGRRVEEPVSLVDLLPTLLDLLDLPHEFSTDGLSLTGAMRGEKVPDRVLFAEYGGRPHNKVKAVWNDRYRYIEFELEGWNRGELYDRRRDPRETEDLSQRRPEKVAEFEALLDRRFGPERRILLEGSTASDPVDPEVEARLRALGYIDGN